MEREERMQYARQGRTVAAPRMNAGAGRATNETAQGGNARSTGQEELKKPSYAVAPPPGSGEVQYASLAGD
ncbi:hypothetical protein EMCG_09645 [[Emmonsia] crescens]|uniref:Uncharacterized protein n=1 Tax=[Emmonsia] crescens TaxID=73230 RepID=A0A0G2I219_9EURO|nr:hypothetical protein EMCG_09645 [Emmonsia crescens UAMH 3008]